MAKTNPKILVVDDDRIILDSLSEFLRLEGYTVGGTRDFKGALQALERDPYHLVVTDVNMPDADGFELLRVIKQRYPDIVVIIITARRPYNFKAGRWLACCTASPTGSTNADTGGCVHKHAVF